MEFSKQEYGSGLLFPSPGDLPNPQMVLTQVSCIAGKFFTIEPPRKPIKWDIHTVEVANRFKGLDLIVECLKNYEWRFMTLYKRQ